jgi:hypothetical protein
MTSRFPAILLSAFLSLAATATGQTCTTSTYGDPCGFQAIGSAAPNGATVRVSFKAVDAPPNTSILFMVGVFAGNIPLAPLSNCSLLIDPHVFAQVHETRADGTYEFSKALPNGNIGNARVQFATAQLVNGQYEIKTSNGILLQCQ